MNNGVLIEVDADTGIFTVSVVKVRSANKEAHGIGDTIVVAAHECINDVRNSNIEDDNIITLLECVIDPVAEVVPD